MPTRLTQTGAEVQEDLYKIEDIDLATEEKAGLMSPEDKTKLDNIEGEIPTKLSDLEDDSTHRTVTDAEKRTWNNKSDFDGRYDSLIGRPYIPQRTSDLRNDSGFITNIVDDLVNYYLKSETYSKAEVQDLIAAVQGVSFVIADELPTASADTMGKIYLVPSADPQTANVKDEYITIDNGESAETRYTWEQIGSTAVNLEGYVTTDALNTALSAYTTTTDLNTLLAGKQDKIDADHKLSYTLLTDTPTIPDAQIQSDWNQADDTKKDFIKNKPTIPTVTGKADKVSGATNGNFAGLDSNGNLTDSGKKASDFATATQGGKADTAYQKPSGGIPASDLASGVIPDVSGFYTKPSGGIPSSDMTEAVRTSLGKADTALQSFTETDPTVPSWAKAANPPTEIFWATYGTTTASEIVTAYGNGKVCAVLHDNKIFILSAIGVSAIMFAATLDSTTSRWVRISRSDDSWSYASTSLQQSTDRVSSWRTTPDDSHYPSEKLVKDSLDAKQATLVGSGTGQNIKTVNNTSLVGTGNIDVTELFVVTYGTTTANEIDAALTAGKTLVGVKDGNYFMYACKIGNAYYFYHIAGSTLMRIVLNNGTWQNSSMTVGSYSKPSGGIPAADIASGVIPDAVSANPTVPSGTTPTSLTGLKIGSSYYDIEAGGGTVTDVTVGGSSVVNASGVAEIDTASVTSISIDSTPTANSNNLVTSGGVYAAIPTIEALTSNEIDTLWTNN